MNLREARNQLARLVDAVHLGSSVVITKHGRPWVRLVPLQATGPSQRRPGRRRMDGLSLSATALFAEPHQRTVIRLLRHQPERGQGEAQI